MVVEQGLPVLGSERNPSMHPAIKSLKLLRVLVSMLRSLSVKTEPAFLIEFLDHVFNPNYSDLALDC